MADDSIKKALVCAVDVLNVVGLIEKGLNWTDAIKVFEVLQDFSAFVKDAALVIPQYESLSDAERAELSQYVVANAKLPAHLEIEKGIQKGLLILISASKILQA